MTVSSTRQGHALPEAVVADLRSLLRGELLTPQDAGYDAARTVWNAMIDRRPALIARCRGVADVITAVTVAREQELLVAVRGGGHNVAGNAVCDGGLMIDLSLMKGIRVDPAARTVRVEPGCLWREVDHETQAFGLATVGGTISATGVAGLTLGGGVGWLSPRYGMAIDNLLAADVVTADGELRHVSAEENPDLFWALRGGGGNLGIVTSFEFQLHQVGPTVLGGLILHPVEQAEAVLRFYRGFAAAQPDELTTYAAILTLPDGTQVIALVPCYSGPSHAEGERVLASLRAFGAPLADTVGPMPYVALQSMLDGAFPWGRRNYWKSSYVAGFSDAAIATLVAHARQAPSPGSVTLIQDFHGAPGRVPADATAFAHRHAPHALTVLANWETAAEDEGNIGWARDFHAAMQPYLEAGVYVNELGHDEAAERVRAAYGANWERLAAVKARYDPENRFRMNQNVPPRR